MLLLIVPEALEGANEKWAGGMQGGVMLRGFASEDRGHRRRRPADDPPDFRDVYFGRAQIPQYLWLVRTGPLVCS